MRPGASCGYSAHPMQALGGCCRLPATLPPLSRRRRSLPPTAPPLPACCPRWEDGQLVKKELTEPSRWDVHSAEEVDVTLGELRLRIMQQARRQARAAAGRRRSRCRRGGRLACVVPPLFQLTAAQLFDFFYNHTRPIPVPPLWFAAAAPAGGRGSEP